MFPYISYVAQHFEVRLIHMRIRMVAAAAHSQKLAASYMKSLAS